MLLYPVTSATRGESHSYFTSCIPVSHRSPQKLAEAQADGHALPFPEAHSARTRPVPPKGAAPRAPLHAASAQAELPRRGEDQLPSACAGTPALPAEPDPRAAGGPRARRPGEREAWPRVGAGAHLPCRACGAGCAGPGSPR